MSIPKKLQWSFCHTQGQLFQLSAERGYDSEMFIKGYMHSSAAKDFDKEFHHVQWAGKAYIMDRMEKENSESILKNGNVFDAEMLYWIGYIYRYWQTITGEESSKIYEQADCKTMQNAYLSYYTLSPETVIEKLFKKRGEEI